jgi:membrane-bound serine protease (ClpP class)
MKTNTSRVPLTAIVACIVSGLILTARAQTNLPQEIDPGPRVVSGTVYVISIDGPIESALHYILRRGVTEAESTDADAIVCKMDTPGGTLEAARDIVNLVENISVPTYTFVEEEAFSAGAIIAMATKNIFMAPGSVIGDAMPIMGGSTEDMPENLQEKMVSATSALMRSAAEQGGHDPQLAEAMVRREIEFKIGDEIIAAEGVLLTLTDREAARIVGDATTPLLSAGTAKDVEDMLEQVGLGDAEVIYLEVTGVEQIARFIKAISPLLMMAGLLGIYAEIKTPGIGIAGVAGLICLAIFFWGHHIAGLAGAEELLLIVIGIGFLAAEIFVIPGFGIAGVLGLLMIMTGLLTAMVQRYPGGSFVVPWSSLEGPLAVLGSSLIGATIGAIVLTRYLPQSRLFKPLRLDTSMTAAGGYVASSSTKDLVGLRGTTLSPLRPSGSARFGDRKLDVITTGQFVDSGQDVRIVESHGSRVLVEPIEDHKDPQPRPERTT